MGGILAQVIDLDQVSCARYPGSGRPIFCSGGLRGRCGATSRVAAALVAGALGHALCAATKSKS